MARLDVVETQRPAQGRKHVFTDCVLPTLLESAVVIGAESDELSQLFLRRPGTRRCPGNGVIPAWAGQAIAAGP